MTRTAFPSKFSLLASPGLEDSGGFRKEDGILLATGLRVDYILINTCHKNEFR